MGVMTPGKIHPSHNCLYVSFGGYEYRYKHNYEILVSRGPCEWISETKGACFFLSFCGIFYKEQKGVLLNFQSSILWNSTTILTIMCRNHELS